MSQDRICRAPMPSGYRETVPLGGWYTPPLPRPKPTSVPSLPPMRTVEGPGPPVLFGVLALAWAVWISILLFLRTP